MLPFAQIKISLILQIHILIITLKTIIQTKFKSEQTNYYKAVFPPFFSFVSKINSCFPQTKSAQPSFTFCRQLA